VFRARHEFRVGTQLPDHNGRHEVSASNCVSQYVPVIPSLPEIGGGIADQPYISSLDAEHQPNLFPVYYGHPEIPVIELAGTPDIEPPPSMHDTGFAVTNSASLRELGSLMTVGEAAAFWKTHKRTAPRVYTNADIQRLHRS
jgi:hypothetical protein